MGHPYPAGITSSQVARWEGSVILTSVMPYYKVRTGTCSCLSPIYRGPQSNLFLDPWPLFT